ncbi:MAG TPA: ATP-dependent zinc metalloprotease FtsH [Anaerolineae bacterium]|nr:ATP-dependent zinc metalloprotease FtsH [Anaerolineae bacterium]MCB0222156.1 ATP-dependent zinc metalloprotease FtsH [Anaerolineae bacterium]HRV93771.1 ATP-dependent zinc metalloprotease FtsH [Anaerolineae bacterium]
MPPSDWPKQWKDRLPFHPKWLIISLIVAGVAVGSYLFSGYTSGSETSVSQTVQSSRSSTTKPQLVSLPEIVNLVKADQVKSLVVQDNLITAVKVDGSSISARKESNISTIETLKLLGTPDQLLADLPIVVEVSGTNNYFTSLWGLIALVSVVGLIAFYSARNRRSSGGGIGRMPGNMGQSNARLISANGKKDDDNYLVKPQVRFIDVAGADQAKQELQEVVEFLKEPAKFARLGARIPKGVLMSGPPGTGKTLLARAVAGEAGVPFFSISGSEFVEMYVGVGAARVRDLFKRAREHAPCVVFVDEIDAVGRQRGASMGSGNDEREQTLNQILVEMDGFSSFTTVIVLASTNRPDILDAALLRPGRFDRKVILDRPDAHGREAILRVHTRGKPLARDIVLSDLARLTPGFVGADLENLVNEAAILAARRNLNAIGQQEFQDSMERIVAGPERQGKILSADERKVIAFHEAGHALVMHNLEYSDPVHKVSIVSRGMALGYTMPLPENDRYLLSREAFEDQIVGLFGGRAAEEIIFKRITTGAANDLERATKLARAMVTRYGFSSQGLGLRCFGEEHGNAYLGTLSEMRDYSEAVAQAIDQEIRQILDHAYQRAKEILINKQRKLEELAHALLEFETIDRPQFEMLMA